MYEFNRRVNVANKTADYTILIADEGSVFTNKAASGTVVFSLPADAHIGTIFRFDVMAAQALRIDPPAAKKIWLSGTLGGAGKYLWADAIDESCEVYYDGTDWIARKIVGTWGLEA